MSFGPSLTEEMAKIVGDLLDEEAVEVFRLASERADHLSTAEELDYLLEGAEFTRYRHLQAVRPNSYTELLVAELAAATEDGAHLPDWQRRAASLLLELGVMVQSSSLEAATVLYEQLKLFNTWYENNRKEVQDV